jgi:hypothetical protein
VLFFFIVGALLTISGAVAIVKARTLSAQGTRVVRDYDSSGRRVEVEKPVFSVSQIRAVGVSMFVFGALMALSTCVTTVDARSVGVKTSFNKYSGTIGPGLSFKGPQEDVEEWTTRNQVSRFQNGVKDDEDDDNFHAQGCITVRLGNQSNACIDTTVTWKVTEKSVKGLWEQHKTFDAARRDFVTPQAVAAVGFVFDGYNPLQGITGGVTEVKTVNNEEWTRLLKPKLSALYAARSIELVDAQVTFVHYDEQTTNKLRDIANEVAATEIAKQKIKTAEAEAAASAARKAQSGSTCVDLYRDLAAMDQLKNINAGFNCGAPSGALVGAQPR